MTSNFSFLADRAAKARGYAQEAESLYLADRWSQASVELRKFAEFVAIEALKRNRGMRPFQRLNLDEAIRQLSDLDVVDSALADALHRLRRYGNSGSHDDDRQASLTADEVESLLREAHQVAEWFHREFTPAPGFQAPAWVPPDAPPEVEPGLVRLTASDATPSLGRVTVRGYVAAVEVGVKWLILDYPPLPSVGMTISIDLGPSAWLGADVLWSEFRIRGVRQSVVVPVLARRVGE